MFAFRRPQPAENARFIVDQSGSSFSYQAIGATRTGAPEGFAVDHNRVKLGAGKGTFDTACRALTAWKMFDIGWVELFPPDAPIAPGTTVAVLARICGLWFLNACRIAYVVDEDQPVRRFGFAYGTLMEHAESGEERFTIEWNREDDSVWYDLFAFSRPNQLLARIGYPLSRRLQKRFANDSKRAMQKHCRP